MKKLIESVLGSSPRTTIIAGLTAAMYAYVDIDQHGFTDWKQAIVPFGIAFMGRVAKDSNGINRKEDAEILTGEKPKP